MRKTLPLLSSCTILALLVTAATAGAATSTATFEDAVATITVPDTVVPLVPFDVTVEGNLVGFPSFSGFSFGVFRDAVWAYDANHFAIVESGILIDQSGVGFGIPFSSSYTQTLPAGTYTYTFIFGQRAFGHGWYDVAVDIEVTVGSPSIEVDVDVQPLSCPNSLGMQSLGVLPLAILGSADLDVAALDPTTVTLAGVAPLRSAVEDVAAPLTDRSGVCACTAEGPDGYLDLTLKFDRRQLLDALGSVSAGDTVVLSVSGELVDGTPFKGQDCVVIRGSG